MLMWPKMGQPQESQVLHMLIEGNMNKSLNMRKQTHLSKFHCLDFSLNVIVLELYCFKRFGSQSGLIDIFVQDRLGSYSVIKTI